MKRLLFGIVTVFLASAFSALGQVTDSDKLQAQIFALREENFALKQANAQCQVNLANAVLPKEREALTADQTAFREAIRKKLGAKTDDEVDWGTLTLRAK